MTYDGLEVSDYYLLAGFTGTLCYFSFQVTNPDSYTKKTNPETSHCSVILGPAPKGPPKSAPLL